MRPAIYLTPQAAADGTTACYRATPASGFSEPVGTLLRDWYDEAEFQAVSGADALAQIVIADRGQDHLDAAKEYCEAVEGKHLLVTGGSSFCFTSVSCQVEATDQQTANFRESGTIDGDTYAFYATTVFVPENERARGYSMAGNTVEYSGSDPQVPDGAYERYCNGYITFAEDGWHGQLVGTGW